MLRAEQFLKSALFAVALLGDELFKGFDKGVHVGEDGGDGGLFCRTWQDDRETPKGGLIDRGQVRCLLAGKQTTNLASINKTALGCLPVILPCPAEQTAIAAVLSDMDALIESFEQLIAKKRYRKQGALQELLRPKHGDRLMKLRQASLLRGRIGWQGLKQTEF